jgi:uncharacterized protein with HEPN domain
MQERCSITSSWRRVSAKVEVFKTRTIFMPLYAVIRCLEIISEASRRLSAELKARHAEIIVRIIPYAQAG